MNSLKKHNRLLKRVIYFFLIIVSVFLVSCNQQEPIPQVDAPDVSTKPEVTKTLVIATFTLTAVPPTTTSTTAPTATPTPTETATPTITPTPTNTPTPELPVGLGTDVPQPLHQLKPENASQIVELAQYGDGELLDIQLSQDESVLYVIYSTGLYIYDIDADIITKAVQTLITHDPNTTRIVISPDGAYLALVKEPDIEVWEIASGSLLHTFSMEEQPYYFEDFSFAPDSQSLTITASLPSGKQVWLWRVIDGELLLNQPSAEAEFWPNGNLLAIYSYETGLELRDTADGTLVNTLVGPEPYPSSMAFSPDGSVLATAYRNSLWLWDIVEQQVIKQLNRRNGGNGAELSFLHEGQILSMYTRELDSLRLWDVVDGALIADLTGQQYPILSSDRSHLVTQSVGQIHYWDLESDRELLWLNKKYQSFYTDLNVTFVADGDRLFIQVPSRSTPPQLLDATDGSVVQTFDGQYERYGFAMSDGDILVTISQSGLNFRNAENGDIHHTIEGGEHLLFPDDKIIATWSGNLGSNLALWDISSGSHLQETALPISSQYYISHKQLRPEGEQIPESYIPFLQDVATSSNAGQYNSLDGLMSIRSNGSGIDVFDVSDYSGEGVWDPDLLYTISVPQMKDLSFSPDGQMIAAVTDEEISVWHSKDGSPMITIPVSSHIVDFTFSPDGQRIYATNSGRSTEYFSVWDIATGNRLYGDSYSLEVQNGNSIHKYFDRPMALSVTGDLIAYSSENCQVQIRYTSDWQVLQTFDPGCGHHGQLAFSFDGMLLATSFQGGEIKLWDTTTGELVHTILDHDSPIDDEPTVRFAFSKDGQFFGTSANGVLHLWGIWP